MGVLPGRSTRPGALAEEARRATLRWNVAIIRDVLSVVLVGCYAPLSQLTLSPVYGSIPASLYHSPVVALVVALAGVIHFLTPFRRMLSVHLGTSLPVICMWIPTLQSFMFIWSSSMGGTAGPLVTELFTYFPLLLVAALLALERLDGLGLEEVFGRASVVPVILVFTVVRNVSKLSAKMLLPLLGLSSHLTRSSLQLYVAGVFAVLSPSKLLVLALPSLVYSLLYNVHMPFATTTTSLQQALAASAGYELLARQDSLTGYISVLDSHTDGFRVMRCDHSLLGGNWLRYPDGTKPSSLVAEPIYAIFSMLEAVRLVERGGVGGIVEGESPRRDAETALVIGLGVGTSPNALIRHGINTTIVEIDPVVHDYATRFFGLSPRHTSVIGDAVQFVDRARRSQSRFDYIIHDVFTGGAEPVDLFTFEFLSGLRDLLQPNGAIAMNYAGDVAAPSARLVVRTILAVFPTCRIFREGHEPDTSSKYLDFTNMVLFCTKAATPLRFRSPVEADFLGSLSRRQHLVPRYEIDATIFGDVAGDDDVLRKDSTERLTRWQEKSALGHWKIMRKVLPDAVWVNW
ncbi:MAG: hypothetical protein M1838_005306 [Thelocarpon superellum]|nr:MAG: hypothetical protein M1838_005306 [Thelocarpon superellum]